MADDLPNPYPPRISTRPMLRRIALPPNFDSLLLIYAIFIMLFVLFCTMLTTSPIAHMLNSRAAEIWRVWTAQSGFHPPPRQRGKGHRVERKEFVMLPIVQLRHVTRDDVQRIAEWLSDYEVSSRWFGHYACGDPVHRGYEPGLMMGASSEDWVRVFDHDRRRVIFSIYAGDEGHVGECQAVFDDNGDVEISLLIGRKELWHRGYGAAAALQLLDRLFYDYPVDQAWVSIPQDNIAALRLFNRLGFSYLCEKSLCQTPDGGELRTTILALPASEYLDRKLEPQVAARTRQPIVTVTGLPGSGSEHIAAEAARLLRADTLDAGITDALCREIGRTPGEIESLEAGYTSFWASAFRAALSPWERYGAVEASPEMFGAFPVVESSVELPDYLTKEEYLDGLRAVFASVASDGATVIHGRGALTLAPSDMPRFNVFVGMNLSGRAAKAQLEENVSEWTARKALKKMDKRFASLYKRLYGIDPLDPGQYDLTISMDRLTVESAARIVSSAVTRSARQDRAVKTAMTNGTLNGAIRRELVSV